MNFSIPTETLEDADYLLPFELLYLEDYKLEPMDYAKYLDVYIDSKLTWEKDVQMTNSKLQKESG